MGNNLKRRHELSLKWKGERNRASLFFCNDYQNLQDHKNRFQAGIGDELSYAAGASREISVVFPFPFASAPMIQTTIIMTSSGGNLISAVKDVSANGFVARITNTGGNAYSGKLQWFAYAH